MPLLRKMPKRGFSNARFREGFLAVNIGRISSLFESGATVDRSSLVSAGLVPDRKGIVKILGNGDVAKALHFKAVSVSASAKVKIEAAGGSVEAVK